jgi:hypothetical protein
MIKKKDNKDHIRSENLKPLEVEGVLAYAKYMGWEPLEPDLFYIAYEGFYAELPKGWEERFFNI